MTKGQGRSRITNTANRKSGGKRLAIEYANQMPTRRSSRAKIEAREKNHERSGHRAEAERKREPVGRIEKTNRQKTMSETDELEPRASCAKCGDKLYGHEDENETHCRWCVTGWHTVETDSVNDAQAP